MSGTSQPEDPPPYDDPEDDDINKTLDPTILVLSGQSIHAESADSAPLYELSRSVAKLSYATSEIELRRVDRIVRTNANDEPAIRPRARHIYDLKHARRFEPMLGGAQASHSIFVKAASRKSLGSFAFDKSLMRSRWKALPLDPTGQSNKTKLTAFGKDPKPLFEVRHRNGTYEWADAGGNAVAVEDGGEEQKRLLLTASLQRETLDALVALWCCRLWQYSAEHEISPYSGGDSGKHCVLPLTCDISREGAVVECVADVSLVRRRFALAKELPTHASWGLGPGAAA